MVTIAPSGEGMVIEQLMQQGLSAHRAGQLDRARQCYDQVLALNPGHADAQNLRGLALLQSGDAAAAIEATGRAIALAPRNWMFFANHGQALLQAGRHAEALAAFNQAGKINPAEPQLQLNAANCLVATGDLAGAEARLRKLTQRHSGFAAAWFNLANTIRDQNRLHDAEPLYRRALALDASMVDAHNNLGNLYQRSNRLADAEACFRQAIALAPDFVVAHCNLASTLIDLGRFAEGEAAARQALAHAGDYAPAFTMLAAAIGHQGRLLEAIEWHRRAVTHDPGDARAVLALGLTLREVGQLEEGLQWLARAESLSPDSWHTHFALSTTHLAMGHLQQGWEEFVYRPARENFVQVYPDIEVATTLPADLQGLHISINKEQGFGDQLFFLRWAPELKARGATITYRTQNKIRSLLERVSCLDRIVLDTDDFPAGDLRMLGGDLPLAVGRLSGSFTTPPALPLVPDPAQVARMREKLAQIGEPPYIGLTWRGGVPPEEQRGMAWHLYKEAPLADFGAALRTVPGTLLSLQRNPVEGETERIAAAAGRFVHDFSALNDDLEGMLALLAVIDQYVGVSNTNMHLRAGIGKSAAVLVPCPAEWRWLPEGDTSPWFPGFRIFRQTVSGDWIPALGALTAYLTGTLTGSVTS